MSQWVMKTSGLYKLDLPTLADKTQDWPFNLEAGAPCFNYRLHHLEGATLQMSLVCPSAPYVFLKSLATQKSYACSWGCNY